MKYFNEQSVFSDNVSEPNNTEAMGFRRQSLG
jgi:hypothetical protein